MWYSVLTSSVNAAFFGYEIVDGIEEDPSLTGEFVDRYSWTKKEAEGIVRGAQGLKTCVMRSAIFIHIRIFWIPNRIRHLYV